MARVKQILAVLLFFAGTACTTEGVRQVPASEAPLEPHGAMIELTGIPPSDDVVLHFDFGDLNLPMRPWGWHNFRADMTATQLRGFPHQQKGFRVYRGEVRVKTSRGKESTYPVTIELPG